MAVVPRTAVSKSSTGTDVESWSQICLHLQHLPVKGEVSEAKIVNRAIC